MMMHRSLIWDLPVRLFHWSLAGLIAVSFYTGLSGGLVEMDYHMLSGYSILTLVLFRIVWGFVGSRNARFTTFIRGPGAIMSHARTLGQKTTPLAGHNPLGALSVVSLILVLITQAVTGLFANDDIMLEGPLTHLVSDATSRRLTAIHGVNQWLLLVLIAMHLLAIAFYQWVKKDNLILPMVTGWKLLPEAVPPERNHWLQGGLLFLLITAGVYYLVTYV